MRTSKIVLLILFSIVFIKCMPPDPCSFDYTIRNETGVGIKLLRYNLVIPEGQTKVDTIVIENDSYAYDPMGRSFIVENEETVRFLDNYEWVKVVYNNTDTVVHLRDSNSVNYARSVFNLDTYHKTDCEYTYTFTEADYNAAKSK